MSDSKNPKTTQKGFKGFDKNLRCRDFQYEVGKTYVHPGTVSLCSRGFHFCENPLDVLSFYGVSTGNRFAEVEGSDVSDEREKDSKRVSKSIHIEAEISLSHLIGAGIKFIFDKTSKPTSGYYAHSATSGYYAHSATSGDYAHSATSGDYAHSATSGYSAHSATSGYYAHSATSGDYAHSATSGDYAHSATSGYSAHSATSGYYAHSATSGDYAHSATSGDYAHSATSGDYAHSATSGYYAHSATSGDYAHSATSGYSANSATSGYYAHSATSGNYANSATSGNYANASALGKDAVAASIGPNSSTKAALNNWIVCAEWKDGKPLNVKSAKVDGKKIKADTFYILRGGKFVEVSE